MNTITFTQAAKEHIKTQVQKEAGEHFRLWIKTTGCSGYMYMPEIVPAPKEGDIELDDIDGVKIFLDGNAADIIKGTEVDYIEKTLGFKQMVFNNPNATGMCGCGESFKLKGEAVDGD